MSIQILENFLPKELEDKLEELICHHQFPWYWRSSSTYGIYKEGKDYQFVHIIYHENTAYSEIFELARNILFEIEMQLGITIKDLYKIKANLTTPSALSEEDLNDAIHIDMGKSDKEYYTLVYYVNDSDGDTIIYDDNKNVVKHKSPQKGSAIFFPSHTWHRHTPPKSHKRRIVLNFVFEL